MEKIRLGILGVGNIGGDHVKRIVNGECPEITLGAVCDLKPERLAWAKETAGEALPTFADAREMIESGLIDSLLVAVPHYDHPKYAMMAMEAGLHVLIEKPAGVYTKQVLEMNECAKKHDVVFGIMMNQRTNCIYRKMREIVKSGELGAIKRTNWLITNWYRAQAYYDSGDWRATWSGEGGGVLLNQCPHNLDLWQWICGMPKKVHAHLHFGKWHDIEVEDDVTAYFEYENGATGVFITSTADAPGTNRFEVCGTLGKLVCEDDKLTYIKNEVDEREFCFTEKTGFARPKTEKIEVETDGKNPQHVGILRNFTNAILGKEELFVKGEEGLMGVELMDACLLSGWLGKEVELPIDDELYYQELMKRVATSRQKSNVREVVADTSNTFGSAK